MRININKYTNTLKVERKVNMIHTFLLKTVYRNRGGVWRAEYIRKHNILHHMGKNCYWENKNLPSDACLVSVHNNVRIAYGVHFITHDIFLQMLNENKRYKDLKQFRVHFGTIEIFDDVCIGGEVTIMPNVKIGPNAIVAGGSVVTKDVPEGTVVGGNPAKIICSMDEFVQKRINVEDIEVWNSPRNDLESFYWK